MTTTDTATPPSPSFVVLRALDPVAPDFASSGRVTIPYEGWFGQDELVQPGEDIHVEPGHGQVDRIRSQNDRLKSVTPDLGKRFETGFGDREHLALRIVALTLGAHPRYESLSHQPLDDSVNRTGGDVGPLVDMFFFGEKPEGVTVHRPALSERPEHEKSNG